MMLVGAAPDKIDPVMMNRAIANGVLGDFRSGVRRPDALAVMSLARLLKMYAEGRLEDNYHIGVLEQEKFDDFNALDSSRAYELLRSALERTRVRLGYTREELVAGLDPLLLHFAKDDDDAGVDLPPGDVAKLEQFLAALSETLTEVTESG
jgi:hypothetical protein